MEVSCPHRHSSEQVKLWYNLTTASFCLIFFTVYFHTRLQCLWVQFSYFFGWNVKNTKTVSTNINNNKWLSFSSSQHAGRTDNSPSDDKLFKCQYAMNCKDNCDTQKKNKNAKYFTSHHVTDCTMQVIAHV